MRNFLSTAAILFVIAMASPAFAEDPALAPIFKSRNLEGTIVISSLDGSRTYVYNEARAGTPLLPASTFKIPNTLIALEEGVIGGGNEIIPWDGKDKGVPAWNRDQSIETAFPASCVWFYQELAKRVGLEKYRDYLQRMHYGNGNAGPEVTTFWLQGDLRISALEQVEFLRKLYLRQFPFNADSYHLLKKVMVMDRATSHTLYGKTGWTVRTDSPVGWLVGYVEVGGDVWLYATNIVMTRMEEAPLRKDVTVEALKAKGII